MTVFTTPTFLVYARPRKVKVPAQFLHDQAGAGASIPGFVYSLARSSPTQARDAAQAVPPGTPARLFSPDIDLLPHTRKPSSPVYDFSRVQNLPAIDASPSKAAGWLQEIVTTQADLGASAIITPSFPLELAHSETELVNMLDWATRARRTPGAEALPFLTGLTLQREWIAKRERRELLLNQLTDRADEGYYLVVRWAPPSKSDEQLGDRAALEGLREVVEVLRDDDREVVLGRLGLAAWPLVALGASATTASAIPSHILRDPVKFARKKGAPSIPRVPIYLDRHLLSYVEFRRMAALNAVSGITHCACPDCNTLASGYSDTPAFRHYLRTLSTLHDQTVAAKQPRQFALREVRAAQTLLSASPSLALPARTTAHLAVWEALLT